MQDATCIAHSLLAVCATPATKVQLWINGSAWHVAVGAELKQDKLPWRLIACHNLEDHILVINTHLGDGDPFFDEA